MFKYRCRRITIFKDVFYDGEQYSQKMYLHEVYWFLFEAMINWNYLEKQSVLQWFVGIGGDIKIYQGFGNMNWWKRCIGTVLKGVIYQREKVKCLERLKTLTMIIQSMYDADILLNLMDHDIGAWMAHLAYLIVMADFEVKSDSYADIVAMSQINGLNDKFDDYKNWSTCLTSLFTMVYFYGRKSAFVVNVEDEFDECFTLDMMEMNYQGPSYVSEEFAQLCIKLYMSVFDESDSH